MSRALPLENPADAIVEESEATTPLTGTVAVYDPAMCCSTGVCGPSVDPSLLAAARDLRWLTGQGVSVQRYGLSQEPDAFVKQPKVTGLMQAFGDKALPATLVNGEVLAYGRYPSRDEIITALGANAKADVSSAAKAKGDCCTPGSGCC